MIKIRASPFYLTLSETTLLLLKELRFPLPRGVGVACFANLEFLANGEAP